MLFDQQLALGAVVLNSQTVGRIEIDILNGEICIAVQQFLYAKLVIVEGRIDQRRVTVLAREKKISTGPGNVN